MKTPLTDEFLQALEGRSDAEPNPYFYSKLRAKMEKHSETNNYWKPSLAFALSLALALNIYFLNTDTTAAKNINPAQEFANSFQLSADFNY